MSRSYEKYDRAVVVFGIVMVALLIVWFSQAIYRGVISPSAHADAMELQEEVPVMTLEVSDHNQAVTVPGVEGWPVQKALNILRRNGLVPGVIMPVHSPEPRGVVLVQDQLPGAKVAPGWTVNLSVSAGE